MEFESVNVDLHDQLSSVSAAKMFLEEETNSLQSEMDNSTLVLEKGKVKLNGILREMETSFSQQGP